MTRIARPITRETPALVFDGGRRLNVVCRMDCGGLWLKQKGRRTWYQLPYEAAYSVAVKNKVRLEREDKIRRRRSGL